MSKRVIILGSTGSIGKNAAHVCAHLGYNVVGLAVHSNTTALKEQIAACRPEKVAVFDQKAGKALAQEVDCPVLLGEEGVVELAEQKADIVVAAIVGTRGIRPTFAALSQGTTVALANKEALVSAGQILAEKARERNSTLLPIDSEHSALFQCLVGEKKEAIHSLTLTASGGPFYKVPESEIHSITLEDALKHPTWTMGVKNTVDSSTLMNKGLEVIEAHHLFEIPLEKINVVIHPQSLIHSFVNFVDGSSKAQISANDMKIPIQYALTYPERNIGTVKPLDFTQMGTLEFYPPRYDAFPCLRLALESVHVGGTMPCFMNAANESLVAQFAARKIGWADIGKKLERLMTRYSAEPIEDIEHVLSVDAEAKRRAQEE